MNAKQFRQGFLSLNIRSKIVLGILVTGGLALLIFAVFASRQTQQITNTLSGRLETSVSQQAEEQLRNTVNEHARLANESFSDVREEVESLTNTWASLQKQKNVLRQNRYWDAQAKLTRQVEGRYGNPVEDVSSVFVPASANLDENLMDDLNISAYLDFYAPGILDSHPALRAVYAIDTRGVIRYYPNNDLLSKLSKDFDATQRPYYVITSPL